jgi:hypothetical protein
MMKVIGLSGKRVFQDKVPLFHFNGIMYEGFEAFESVITQYVKEKHGVDSFAVNLINITTLSSERDEFRVSGINLDSDSEEEQDILGLLEKTVRRVNDLENSVGALWAVFSKTLKHMSDFVLVVEKALHGEELGGEENEGRNNKH